jgi:hypothetical protein
LDFQNFLQITHNSKPKSVNSSAPNFVSHNNPYLEMSFVDIPLQSGGGVRVFSDELPLDRTDLIDVLRSEIPPLQVWRRCAVSLISF